METVALATGAPSSWVTRPERTASWADAGNAAKVTRATPSRNARRDLIAYLQENFRKGLFWCDLNPRPPLSSHPTPRGHRPLALDALAACKHDSVVQVRHDARVVRKDANRFADSERLAGGDAHD